MKIITSQPNFVISNRFSATESREVFLTGNVYNFSLDYNAIDKSDILTLKPRNIYTYVFR